MGKTTTAETRTVETTTWAPNSVASSTKTNPLECIRRMYVTVRLIAKMGPTNSAVTRTLAAGSSTLCVRLARDVERQEARGLDPAQDELVLLPHRVVAQVQVERELAHLLDDARVDEVLEPLPFLVRRHLEPQHVDLVVFVAVHDRLHSQYRDSHVGLGNVVRVCEAVVRREADRDEVVVLLDAVRRTAARRVEGDDATASRHHCLVKVPSAAYSPM